MNFHFHLKKVVENRLRKSFDDKKLDSLILMEIEKYNAQFDSDYEILYVSYIINILYKYIFLKLILYFSVIIS